MNIALLCDRFYPHVGGVERCVMDLALELQKLGNHTCVIADKTPTTLPSHESVNGIPVYRLRFPYILPNPKNILSMIARSIPLVHDIGRIIDTHKVDIINAHFAIHPVFYANLTKIFYPNHVPVVATLHGSDVYILPKINLIGKILLQVNLSWSDRVIVHSMALLKEAETYSKVRDKSHIIPNGINANEFATSNSSLILQRRSYILSVGRFVNHKGFDTLIEASNLLHKICPEIKVLVAGYGPEKQTYIHLIRKLGLESVIDVIDSPERKKIIELMKNCTIFVLPSRSEGMPLVLLEALAAGKAIIATSVGAIPEIIEEGINGLIVEAEDPVQLADAMHKLITERDLRIKMEKRNLEKAKRYQWPTIAKAYIRVFKKVIDQADIPVKA